MKRSGMIQVVAALVFCALLPATALAQRAVSRPFEMSASSRMVVSLTGAYDAEGSGVATHCGLVSMVGQGQLTDPTSSFGWGTITAANGDEIWFTVENNDVTITGGTGRFEGATGSFTMQFTSMFQDGLTISYTWTGSGTITY